MLVEEIKTKESVGEKTSNETWVSDLESRCSRQRKGLQSKALGDDCSNEKLHDQETRMSLDDGE